MPVYDELPEADRVIVAAMSDTGREALRAAGIKPLNDDHAAIFDEACAVYLNACRRRGKPKDDRC